MGAVKVRALTWPALIDTLADRIVAHRPGRWLRVAVDGAPPTRPGQLADSLVDPVRIRGRAAVPIRARDFLRPASIRLELGRTNPDAFYERWLDESGLCREVLDRLGPTGDGRVLPSLWNPQTDRATRADYLPVPPGGVVLVSGELLLGRPLPFDLTVHLWLSPTALTRRTPPGEQWTLPAYQRYEQEVAPGELADVVYRVDDPARPAVVDAR